MDERAALIAMCSNVYHGVTSLPLPPGVVSLGQVARLDIGFRAEAYQIESTHQIVVAIAGTQPTNLPSLANAATIGFRNLPSQQMEAAAAFVRDVTSLYGSATLVGHSSGGLVAQLLAAREQVKPEGEERLQIDRAIGFNSPGAVPFLPALFGNNIPTSFEHIEAVCDSRDIVCRIFDDRAVGMGSSHIGSVEYINPVHNSEPIGARDLFNPYALPFIIRDLSC